MRRSSDERPTSAATCFRSSLYLPGYLELIKACAKSAQRAALPQPANDA
jgi:hypothetical protein